MVGYRIIMWGFLFTLFNFRIQGIDVLPDFIGYILFATGLQRLDRYSTHFRRAVPWTIVMVILSLFEVYQRSNTQPGFHVNGMLSFPFPGALGIFIALLYGAAVWIIDLVVVYHICMGTVDHAAQNGQNVFAAIVDKRWSYYLTFKVLSLVAIMVSIMLIHVGFFVVLIIIGMLIYDIVMIFLMMGLMSEADRTLS